LVTKKVKGRKTRRRRKRRRRRTLNTFTCKPQTPWAKSLRCALAGFQYNKRRIENRNGDNGTRLIIIFFKSISAVFYMVKGPVTRNRYDIKLQSIFFKIDLVRAKAAADHVKDGNSGRVIISNP
jgi:hypothetical protein